MKRPKKSENSSSDRTKGKSYPKKSRNSKFKGDEGERKGAKPRYSNSRDSSEDSKPKKFTYTRKGSDTPDSKNAKPAKPQRTSGSFKGKDSSRSSKPDYEKRDQSKPDKRKDYSNNKDSGKALVDSKIPESTGLIRLNKFIADAGICSRREADQLIEQGEITVNGAVVTSMGVKVTRQDEVKYKGKRLRAEKLVYVLLNKPKDFITTTDDPENRKTVMDLVKNACEERIYPVGRLDRNTTGLLLFTNDGELAKTLSHPSGNVRKIYKVELDKPLTKVDFAKISEGIELEDGPAKVDEIAALTTDMLTVGVELHSGRNRIVRRIFESLGYEVIRLDRVVYAGLDKQMLPRGKWRFLTDREINKLKRYQR